MFLQNKYTKFYFNITSNAQVRPKPDGYVEKHHIIPKSFGGTNAKSNIAILTAREHFIVHRLLLKMTIGPNKRKMAMALSMFLTGCRNHTGRYQVSSREYEHIRKELSESMKGQCPAPHVMEAAWKSRRGVPISDDQKVKLSESLSKPIVCQLIDPFDVIHSTDNLDQFCEEHNLKFNYMRARFYKQDDQRMVVGPNKGWGMYFGIVQCVGNLSEIRKESASKGWSPNRKPHKVKSTAMLVSLQHPNGEVFCDIPLKRFCKEHNLPPSQVQSAPSGTHLVGKWAGWIKL